MDQRSQRHSRRHAATVLASRCEPHGDRIGFFNDPIGRYDSLGGVGIVPGDLGTVDHPGVQGTLDALGEDTS